VGGDPDVPMEFLTDDELAAYGRYAGAPSQADLDRVFFLDDADRVLVDRRRGTHMRVGFALQLVTVRWLGTFLEEPLDVPGAVLDFVAGQLEVADPSQVKRYTEGRRPGSITSGRSGGSSTCRWPGFSSGPAGVAGVGSGAVA